MGKKNKAKKNKETKEVKKVVAEEVKKDVKKDVKNKEENSKTQKELKKEQKAIKKENKKKEKETKKAQKIENKEAKKKEKSKLKEENKEEIEKNESEKALIKKAKKASNNDTKIILGIVFAVIFIAVGIFGYYFYKLNSEVIATYDGGKVTAADYEVYYKTFAPMLEYYGYPASIIPEQIANKAALDQIIVVMATEAGVTVSDEDKASVEEVFNDEEQLATFVEQGIDIGRMKKLYMNDYLISAYLEKLAAEAKDEDVINYLKTTYSQDTELDLNQYNTSHILFKTVDDEDNELSEEDKNAKKAQAQAALNRVLNGEDFATVAKELSEDAGTKEEGGKYVMYADGNTMEEYEKAAKTLSDGQIYATLVETDYGYHIIKLDSKVENGRAKNETERDEYVDYKINSLAEEKNLEIDTEALNRLIEKITGNGIAKDETSDEVSEDAEGANEEGETEENSEETEESDTEATPESNTEVPAE